MIFDHNWTQIDVLGFESFDLPKLLCPFSDLIELGTPKYQGFGVDVDFKRN